jgi:hypothetical protein
VVTTPRAPGIALAEVAGSGAVAGGAVAGGALAATKGWSPVAELSGCAQFPHSIPAASRLSTTTEATAMSTM